MRRDETDQVAHINQLGSRFGSLCTTAREWVPVMENLTRNGFENADRNKGRMA